MKAYICDRCGKTFKILRSAVVIKRQSNVVICGKDLREVHLCFDCQTDLLEWLDSSTTPPKAEIAEE